MTIDLTNLLIIFVAILLILLLVFVVLYLKQLRISEVTQQKARMEEQKIHQAIPIQQDIMLEAERIAEELTNKGLTGLELAQIGFLITTHGQFIYIYKGTEELKKKGKKKK